MKQRKMQLSAKRFISLLIALCMIMMPTAAFATDPVAPTQTAGTLAFGSHHSEGAQTANGRLFIKQGDATSFVEISFDGDSGEFSAETMGEVTTLTVKLEPNSGYKLDTVRGVGLEVDGQQCSTDDDYLDKIVSADGYTFDFSSILGDKKATEVTFSLDFGFGEDDGGENPPSPPSPPANKGELTFSCQSNAVNGGDIYYKFNGTGDFVKVGITDNNYDPITMNDSTTSITIKLVPNQNYQLDTVRGVTLRVNGTENKATADDLTALVSNSGYTYNLSTLLGGSAVSECSFDLEFGFGTDDGGETPPTSDGNFRFTCQGDPNGGTVSYKTNSAADYTLLDFGKGKSASISLTDDDTSITIKIEPNTEKDYFLDTDRGVILRVNGTDKFEAKGDNISDFATGHTFNLTELLGGFAVSASDFEIEFEIKNKNGGSSGNSPYEGEYSGTKVENVPLTVTGNVDFCINDSELFNITSEKLLDMTCDYTYDGNGYVDFYLQWHLGNRYTSIIINGTDYYSQLPTPDTNEGKQALLDACKGQLNEVKISVPYSESGYTISGAVKELDDSDSEYWLVGNFLWFYEESSAAFPDDLILNGKMELLGITFNDEPFEQTDYLKWDNDEKGGEAVLPTGAVITVKIIPDYGFQLTSFGVNGSNFGTGDEQSVFTFVVEKGNFHLGANITKVDDRVESGAEAVTDGSIQLGNGEIDTGSVVLSVNTAGDDNLNGFENELANYNDLDGYTINSILDINLNQVLYKGNTTDFWENELNDLSSEAEITLDLADNFDNVVVLHQKHDGSFEKLPTTSENGIITFKTKQFSEFALAVEKVGNDNNEPQIKDDDGKTGWDVISSVIEETKDGGTVTVDMNGTTQLPKDILSDISGKDIDIVLNMGDGFVWTINGKSVTDPKDVDMGVNTDSSIPVKVINALTGECEYTTISLAHNGEFGFTAVLTVEMGEKNQGLFANLYYYNENSEKTEFMCSDKIVANGKADFTFTHASEYVIVLDDHDHGKAADGSTTTSDTTADGDTNPSTGVTMVFGTALISGAAMMIFRKKKK